MLGDRQYLPGYSLLLSDPVVPGLNDLQGAHRLQFLSDMAALGDAVLAVTREAGAIRINFSIYGNLEPELHAHCFPRYAGEAEDLRTRPPWFYPESEQLARVFDLSRDALMMESLRTALHFAGAVVAGPAADR